MAWELDAPSNAAVFTSRRVLEREVEVVRVIRDDEGDWQALDAHPRAEGDAALVALSALLELHPDLTEPVGLLDKRGRGWQAVRDEADAWRLLPFHDGGS
jgi:hypothetical protein